MTIRNTVVETLYSKRGRDITSDNSQRNHLGRLVLKSNRMTERTYDCKRSKACVSMTETHRYYGGFNTYEFCEYTDGFRDPQILVTTDRLAFESKAHHKFLNELTDVKLSVGQIYAERRKTIALIANRVGSLYRAYRSLRRGRNPFNGNRRSDPKRAPELWLEYTYGWVPLVHDVYDALQFEKNNRPHAHIRKKVKGRLSVEELDGGTLYPYVQWNRRNTVQCTRTYSLGADVIVTDPGWAFLNQFDISNPAALAWELLPYSFVVDWFIPVGDWLRVMNATAGITFRNPYQIIKGDITEQSVVSVTASSGRFGDLIFMGSGRNSSVETLKFSYKERQSSFSLSLPSLFEPHLTTERALSALALLAQIFNR